MPRLFMQNAISGTDGEEALHFVATAVRQTSEPTGLYNLAYELAIRMPLESEQILRTQRARIDDPDRLRQFDFISRAAVSILRARYSVQQPAGGRKTADRSLGRLLSFDT